MRRLRRPSRPTALALSFVLSFGLLAPVVSVLPTTSVEAAPAPEPLPPYFAPSATGGAYTITVNGVELASDATGFNHWGESAPLFASRTGLLVEADLVEVRVERRTAGGSPFAVGIEVFVCGEFLDDFFCGNPSSAAPVAPSEGDPGDPGLTTYRNDSECTAVATTVRELEGTDSARLGSLVGSSSAVSGVQVFSCVLRMQPSGAPPILGLNVEIGTTATFRTRAIPFIQNLWFAAFDGGGNTTFAVLSAVDTAGCTFVDPTTASSLADDLDSGVQFEWSEKIECPDGRIDLADGDNEVHSLSVFANPRVFATDLAAWVDATAGGFDPSASTLRVPTCAASGGAVPCLESISSGWGMNLTDVSTVLPGVTLPSAELTLVRTARDASVGYGTVAQEGAGDRVSFALRVPTGTVRGASWANMVRAAGYLFSEVVAYGIDTSPTGHIVLSATLEPRSRSTALDSATFSFDCQVSVGGGTSTAEDCDIPDGFLEIDQLRMYPRAWVSAAYGSEESPSYRATKKVLGWRIDTIPATCDDTRADFDPFDDCYDVPDPNVEPVPIQVLDRLYTACGNTVYVDDETPLFDNGKLDEIASEDPDCDPFLEGVAPNCSSPEGGDFCPVETREVHLAVRDQFGMMDLDDAGRPITTIPLTDAGGNFLLFSDLSGTTPLALAIGSTLAYVGCTSMCYEVEAPAIRGKVDSDVNTELAVYNASGSWTHTLVQTVTPVCISVDGGGCLQGRRIDWLSELDGSFDFIVPLGDSIVSVLTETANFYEVGDRILFGGVESTELDGPAGLTIVGRNDFAFAFTVSSDVVAALTTLGDEKGCARDGSGFLDTFTLCPPDVAGWEVNPSRLILRTRTPHGFGAAGTTLTGANVVTTTLLGNEFDGTFEAIVIDEDEIAIDGRWFATDAYVQSRDGVLVRGDRSKVIVTETTLTMYLEGLPENQAALAGGFVATNGQTFTFGEDLLAGRAFDFAVAGPSRTSEGGLRSSDGFFQAFIPAAFLDETFDLTVASAVDALDVNRRDDGSVGTVGFEGDPDIVTAMSGLLIRSEGFSYSAPYFAAERREPRDPSAASGSGPGFVVMPDGRDPSLPPGSAAAIVGGVEVPVSVTTMLGGRGLIVEAAGIRLEVLVGAGSQLVDLGGRLALEVVQGGQIQIAGQGFAPGSPVYVWLFSEPELLAILTADEAGATRGGVPFDGWASGRPVPPGGHTLQLAGIGPDGDVRALNLGIRVVTRLTPRRGPVPAVNEVTAGSDAPGPTSPPSREAAPSAPPAGGESAPPSTPPAPPAVIDATENVPGGGGALARTLVLVGVLVAGLAAYGVFAGRRRRAGG